MDFGCFSVQKLIIYIFTHFPRISLTKFSLNGKASTENQARNRTLGLRKNGPPKKWILSKNLTLQPKKVAICRKSYERQCRSDSFS